MLLESQILLVPHLTRLMQFPEARCSVVGGKEMHTALPPVVIPSSGCAG